MSEMAYVFTIWPVQERYKRGAKCKCVLKPYKPVLVDSGGNCWKEAGLVGQIHAQNHARADEVARITYRHAENHFDPAVRFDPFAGPEPDAARAHVFGVAHEPSATADAAKFNR